MPESPTPVSRPEVRHSPRRSRPGPRTTAPVRRSEELRRRVLIVGAPQDVPRALNHPALLTRQFDIVASVAIDIEGDGAMPSELFFPEIRPGDAILVAGPLGESAMRRVTDLALLHHCELLAVMPTEVLYGHEPVIVWNAEAPLVQLAPPARGSWQLTAKRAIDIVLGSVALVLVAPLLAVLMLLIRIESPGSPIFRHERVGFRGRRFQCLKLRTMRMDAEEQLRSDPELYAEYRRNHFKIPEDRDPRVTRFGRILRQTSFDELPQLWNVLVGDMSLVGPRPVLEDELEFYQDARDLVLSVRPGITGAWAVNGRHEVGYPERCELELRYVREWNILRDAPIMAKTLLVAALPLRQTRDARGSD